MSKTRFALLAVALALAAPAFAAAETYNFDKSHTNVGFQVRHIFTMVSGRFTDYAGTIQVDRAKPESSTVEFTIQATSIDTSEPRRDQHLRSADFFDVANNPTITFKSTSVQAQRQGQLPRDGRPHDARRHEAGHAARDAARRRQGPDGQREDGPRDRGHAQPEGLRTRVEPGPRDGRACWSATRSRSRSRSRPTRRSRRRPRRRREVDAPFRRGCSIAPPFLTSPRTRRAARGRGWGLSVAPRRPGAT